MRKQTRVAIGVLMVVVGGLWCVQGLGWLGGSEMTGHSIWAVIGAAVIVGGVVVALRAARGEDATPAWATDPARDAASDRADLAVRAPERQPDPPAHPPAHRPAHPPEHPPAHPPAEEPR